MLKEQMSLLIFSCEKFSDLWDANIRLMEQNWPDRNMETFLVTDAAHPIAYPKVQLIAAGEDASFSARVRAAVKQVRTKYVFVTLDDYFLIEPVSNERMEYLLQMMEREELDYLRFFPNPKKATGDRLDAYRNVRSVTVDRRYSVNLYPAIWRTEFLASMARGEKNPWAFEASLQHIATELGARCAVDCSRDYRILDVVRKGKILNKANLYLKKHDLYHGDREVQSIFYEIALGLRTIGVRHAPAFLVDLARKFMMKRGHHYYSQEYLQETQKSHESSLSD